MSEKLKQMQSLHKHHEMRQQRCSIVMKHSTISFHRLEFLWRSMLFCYAKTSRIQQMTGVKKKRKERLAFYSQANQKL